MDKLSQQIIFDFRVFLEDEVAHKIQYSANRLLELTPMNAKAKLSLTMPFRKVKGIFSLTFLGNTYTAEAKSDDPLVVWEELEGKMLKQINQWKAVRFEQPRYAYKSA